MPAFIGSDKTTVFHLQKVGAEERSGDVAYRFPDVGRSNSNRIKKGQQDFFLANNDRQSRRLGCIPGDLRVLSINLPTFMQTDPACLSIDAVFYTGPE